MISIKTNHKGQLPCSLIMSKEYNTITQIFFSIYLFIFIFPVCYIIYTHLKKKFILENV